MICVHSSCSLAYLPPMSSSFLFTYHIAIWDTNVCLYQANNRAVAQLVECIVFVIDSVLPLVRKLPQSVVEELEQDLKQMIVRHSFFSVVHACIKYSTFFTTIMPWFIIFLLSKLSHISITIACRLSYKFFLDVAE